MGRLERPLVDLERLMRIESGSRCVVMVTKVTHKTVLNVHINLYPHFTRDEPLLLHDDLL